MPAMNFRMLPVVSTTKQMLTFLAKGAVHKGRQEFGGGEGGSEKSSFSYGQQ